MLLSSKSTFVPIFFKFRVTTFILLNWFYDAIFSFRSDIFRLSALSSGRIGTYVNMCVCLFVIQTTGKLSANIIPQFISMSSWKDVLTAIKRQQQPLQQQSARSRVDAAAEADNWGRNWLADSSAYNDGWVAGGNCVQLSLTASIVRCLSTGILSALYGAYFWIHSRGHVIIIIIIVISSHQSARRRRLHGYERLQRLQVLYIRIVQWVRIDMQLQATHMLFVAIIFSFRE